MDAVTPASSRIAVWDVVRVDLPYADEPKTRRRPALVVATPAIHGAFTILWVMMITSASRGLWPLDVPVSDLAEAGLSVPCVIRPPKIATLDARHATRIGHLNSADRARVAAAARAVLADVLSM